MFKKSTILLGPPGDLISNLAKMQETGELCDFYIRVRNVLIAAHKCVLAASSEYFRAHLRFHRLVNVDDEEDAADNQERRLRIQDTHDLTHLGCSPEIVTNVIRSFYTNSIEIDPLSTQEILAVADFLQLPNIHAGVSSYMHDTLDHNTAILYLQIAKHFRVDVRNFQSRCARLIGYHFHDHFIDQRITQTCNRDMLSILRELDMFKFCSPAQIFTFFAHNLKLGILKDEELGREQLDRESALNMIISSCRMLAKIMYELPVCHIYRWRNEICHAYTNECTGLEDLPLDVARVFVTNLFNIACTLSQISPSNSACKCKSCHFNAKGDGLSLTTRPSPIFTGEGHNESQVLTDDLVGCGHFCCTSVKAAQAQVTVRATAAEDHSVSPAASVSEDGKLKRVETSAQQTCGNKDNSTENPTGAKSAHNDSSGKAVHADSSTKRAGECSDGESSSDDDRKTCKSHVEKKVRQKRDVLILLSPSIEMAQQVMAAEDDTPRPLVLKPELDISIYDTYMQTWQTLRNIEFPVRGRLLDKHAWRIAFLNNCLYMVSLYKKLILEYNIKTKEWTTLKCKHPFLPHGDTVPVKSVVPIVVAGKLLLLSMSKKVDTEGQSSSQQRFYEMVPEKKAFIQVASVEDKDLQMPIAHWSVSGDVLITVKSSCEVHRQLSDLKFVHLYNARTRQLVTHKLTCSLENGMKLLVRDRTMYLLDKAGWYRSFNLDEGTWTGLTKHTESSTNSLYERAGYAETLYPALTRVTCNAGLSRWQVTTCPDPVEGYLEELRVSGEGSLALVQHPPPPRLYLTAMCAGIMDSKELEKFEYGIFEYPVSNNAQHYALELTKRD